jgi:hypothetical protein
MADVTRSSSARSLREQRAPEITEPAAFMRRNSRDRWLVGLVGAGSVALGCSRLTAPDWGLIPLNEAGTSTGATDAGGAGAGEAAGGTGETAVGGAAGETSGGEGAAAGGAEVSGGSAGKGGSGGVAGSGGNGGTGNGGVGGVGGTGGGAGSGGTGGGAGMAGSTGVAGAPPCTGTPGALDNALVLFAGPAAASGARGGRPGLDSACEAERVKLKLTQTKTHAFITITSTDFIGQWSLGQFLELPKDRRVVGPTGIQLATTFSDLVDGTIEQSLVCAKVFPAGTKYWLTGNQIGCSLTGTGLVCGQPGPGSQVQEETCNGWTLGTYDPLVQARFGSTTVTDDHWLIVASKALNLRESCDVATDPILCLAYTL